MAFPRRQASDELDVPNAGRGAVAMPRRPLARRASRIRIGSAHQGHLDDTRREDHNPGADGRA